MSKIKSKSDTDTANIMKNNFTNVFLQNLINNGKVVPKGRRYCEETKQFATTLFFYSPKAYNYVRYVLLWFYFISFKICILIILIL